MQKLTGKVAVVTGALGGIGKEICSCLAEEGTRIVMVDVVNEDQATVVTSVQSLGGAALYHQTDISVEDSVASLYAAIRAEFGGVDILVNCAGLVGRRDAAITDPLAERDFYLQEPFEEWLAVMRVNAWGPELMVKHAFPLMKERGGGSIVSISSLAGRFGAAAAALSYTASKAALVGLAKQWAKMFGRDGIRSNAVAPGPTQTAMLDSMSDTMKERFRAGTLTGRISHPRDVARAVRFLAGDESANITGQVLEVNGGCWIPA